MDFYGQGSKWNTVLSKCFQINLSREITVGNNCRMKEEIEGYWKIFCLPSE